MSINQRTDTETIVLLHALLTTEAWNAELYEGIAVYVREQVHRIGAQDFANMLSAHHSEWCDGCICPMCREQTVVSLSLDGCEETGSWQCARCGYGSDDDGY